MNIMYIYADSPKEWNCSKHNCVVPAKNINKTEEHTANILYINDFSGPNEEVLQKIKDKDLIIVERNLFGDTLTMMQYWKVRNKTILAVFDDAYDIMHPENVSYDFWTNGIISGKNKEGKEVKGVMNPKPLDQFKWGLRIAKAIQVPSVNLAKDWSKYGKTYRINNFLDWEIYENRRRLIPKKKNEIVIGWCGSMSHRASFKNSGILGALKNIWKKYPNVKVLLGGDKGIFDLIDVDNKIFQKYVPDQMWPDLLKSIDIGLAPLSGEYDKRRSWIKGLEYMALKIPWIATDYITYSDLKSYGKLTKNGVKNWTESLSEMIEDYEKFQKLAEEDAYQFALTQKSEDKVKEITLPLYEKLLNEPYP